MQFLKDLLQGKKGLAKTYWLWGVLFSIFFGLFFQVTLAFVDTLIPLENIDIGSNLIVFITYFWGIFISIAIFNAAKFNRDRGFWGWVATILVGIGVIWSTATFITIIPKMPLTWKTYALHYTESNGGPEIEVEIDLEDIEFGDIEFGDIEKTTK